MTDKQARTWLSEARGEEIPRHVRVKYRAGKIYKLDALDGSAAETVIRVRAGGIVFEPSGIQTVEVYDVRNLYGECEYDIPLKDSPFAK